MSSDRDLLQAILDAPDDDDLRLVYADWFTSRGDPRGEFIVVQIELARLGVTSARALALWDEEDSAKLARAATLLRRERALLAAHRERWITESFGGDLPEVVRDRVRTNGATDFGFRRGFIERVSTYADVAALLGRLASTTPPLRSIEIWCAKDESLAILSATPRLLRSLLGFALVSPDGALPVASLGALLELTPHLRTLELRSWTNPVTAQHVACAPESVVELVVPSSKITNDVLAEIMATSVIPRLRSLDVSHNPFADNGAAALLEASPARARLEHLAIAGTNLSGDAFARLTSTTALGLRSLDIRYNRCSPESLASLFVLRPIAKSLEHLEADGSGLDDESAVVLARTCRALRTLRLGASAALSTSGAERVATMLATHAHQLTTLDLSGIPELRPAFFEGLFAGHVDRTRDGASAGDGLRSLSLVRFPGSPPHAPHALDALTSSEGASTLRSLKLQGFDLFEPSAVGRLVSSPRLATLRSLTITSSSIGDEGARVIAGASLPRLAELSITMNGVRARGLRAFAELAPKHLPNLVEIDVGGVFEHTTLERDLAPILDTLTMHPKVNGGPDGKTTIVFPPASKKITVDELERALRADASDLITTHALSLSVARKELTVASRAHRACDAITITVSQKAGNARHTDGVVRALRGGGASTQLLAEAASAYEGRIEILYYLSDKWELREILAGLAVALAKSTSGVAFDEERLCLVP